MLESHSMLETQSAGGVILNKEGKVLVVSQHDTSWSLPKGHVEVGEDALEAAKREIREESGITKLKYIKELGSYQRYKIGKDGAEDTSEFKTIALFLFSTDEESIQPIDPENPRARWVPIENVEDLLTHQKDKEFFAGIIKDQLL